MRLFVGIETICSSSFGVERLRSVRFVVPLLRTRMWHLDCDDTSVIPYHTRQLTRSSEAPATLQLLSEQGLFSQWVRGRLPPVSFGIPLSWTSMRLLDCDDTRLCVGSKTICRSSFWLVRLSPVPPMVPFSRTSLKHPPNCNRCRNKGCFRNGSVVGYRR